MAPTNLVGEWQAFIANAPHISLASCASIPGAPSSLTTTTRSETSLRLEWDTASENGATITGYRIQRRPTGGTWATIVSDTGSTTRLYTNTGLTANTQYQYQVAAINSVGVGPYRAGVDKWTGHCVTTTESCASGYTSILGGSQSGCATAGPVTSPYPDSSVNRYRIISNGQTLTESGCSGTGSEQRTRQAQFSTDNGTNYSFTGSTVNCRMCARSCTCGGIIFNSKGNCASCWSPGAYCWSSYEPNICGYCMWLRSCADQSATIHWCCRN